MNSATLHSSKDGGILYVCQNLREKDRLEIHATVPTWTGDSTELALGIINVGGDQWVARTPDRIPAAVIGATVYADKPRCLSVWAFGTDEWGKVVRLLTKHIKTYMLPQFKELGIIRADCRALSSRDDIRRWLSRLGARAEPGLDGLTTYIWDPSVEVPRQ